MIELDLMKIYVKILKSLRENLNNKAWLAFDEVRFPLLSCDSELDSITPSIVEIDLRYGVEDNELFENNGTISFDVEDNADVVLGVFLAKFMY